jgi:hypothetical protein
MHEIAGDPSLIAAMRLLGEFEEFKAKRGRHGRLK